MRRRACPAAQEHDSHRHEDRSRTTRRTCTRTRPARWRGRPAFRGRHTSPRRAWVSARTPTAARRADLAGASRPGTASPHRPRPINRRLHEILFVGEAPCGLAPNLRSACQRISSPAWDHRNTRRPRASPISSSRLRERAEPSPGWFELSPRSSPSAGKEPRHPRGRPAAARAGLQRRRRIMNSTIARAPERSRQQGLLRGPSPRVRLPGDR